MKDQDKSKEQLIRELKDSRSLAGKLRKEQRVAEQQLRTLVDHAPEAIVIFDADAGKFVDANDNAVRLYGTSRDELLQIGPFRMSPEVQPDGRSSEESGRIRIEEALAGGTPTFEWTHCNAAGEPVPCEVRLVRLPWSGRNLVRGSITDITARKQAEKALRAREEQFRTIYEHAPVMIDAFDQRGRCRLWNQECETNLGYTREEMIACKDPLYLFYPDPEVRNQVLQSIKRADGTFREYNVLAKDGSTRVQLWADFRLPNTNMLISVGHDITERKRTEETLQQSREQLRALAAHLQSVREEERTAIAREMHDELGQVLTALKMDLSKMSKELVNQGMGGDVRHLVTQIDSMNTIIDTTISKIRTLIRQLRPEVLDNLGLVEALEWQAEELKARTGIKYGLQTSVDDADLDKDVSTAIFRIFQEALTNIARHAQATHFDVNLTNRNGTFVLEIADNGIGVSKHKLGDSKTFGLLGMKERALILGGEVEILSEGRGTTVKVSIPSKT